MDVEDLVSKIEEYGETGKEIDVELFYICNSTRSNIFVFSGI